MIRVIYRLQDGTSCAIDAKAGQSIMQVAVERGLEGIIGRCGGFGQCGTCHVYVGEPWLNRLRPPSPEESAMLEGVAAERRPNSRLACQIELSDTLDGLIVTVPERQEF